MTLLSFCAAAITAAAMSATLSACDSRPAASAPPAVGLPLAELGVSASGRDCFYLAVVGSSGNGLLSCRHIFFVEDTRSLVSGAPFEGGSYEPSARAAHAIYSTMETVEDVLKRYLELGIAAEERPRATLFEFRTLSGDVEPERVVFIWFHDLEPPLKPFPADLAATFADPDGLRVPQPTTVGG